MSLENFNERQVEAITASERRILVIAGAGSGKTSVLTKRIARLVEEGTPTSAIFAVTFTNKAAAEMKERIYQQIETTRRDVSVGTFHSMFGRILRDNRSLTNLSENYQTLDTDDQKMLIKSIILDLGLLSGYSAKDMRSAMSKAINESLSYISNQKDFGRRYDKSEWSDYDDSKFIVDCQKVYGSYEKKMNELNLVDFGDLLLYPYEIFKNNSSVLKQYQKKYKEILVDEFQDTNVIQYELVKMLSEKSNLFIVGDDDQSIYGWRGAEIENILGFKEAMDARVVKLEQNYRSFGNILNAANSLISNNEKRMGKNLWTDKSDGDKLMKCSFNYDYEESDFIADEIKGLINKGIDPKQIAILYRNNALSRPLEKSLNKRNIKYVIIGGVSFWKRAEVKDIISMISLIENENNVFAFIRSISRLTVGVGDKSVDKIINYGNENKRTLFESVSDFINNYENKAPKDKLSKSQTSQLIDFKGTFDKARSAFQSIQDLGEVIRIFEMTDFISFYASKETDEAQSDRRDNINSLVEFANDIGNDRDEDEKIETLSDFINYAMLQSAADEKSVDDSIQLMTIHSSKGLEFEYVFLNGLNNKVIPSPMALMEGRLDEERRLFYVAITRAKIKLYLTSYDFMYGEETSESIFLDEIPNDYIQKVSKSNRSDVYYKKSSQPDSHLNNLYKGASVNHPKYGYGVVDKYKVDGDYVIVYANFNSVGYKAFSVNKSDLA